MRKQHILPLFLAASITTGAVSTLVENDAQQRQQQTQNQATPAAHFVTDLRDKTKDEIKEWIASKTKRVEGDHETYPYVLALSFKNAENMQAIINHLTTRRGAGKTINVVLTPKDFEDTITIHYSEPQSLYLSMAGASGVMPVEGISSQEAVRSIIIAMQMHGIYASQDLNDYKRARGLEPSHIRY